MTRAPEHAAPDDGEEPSRQRHLCPVWIGYLLLSPLRRLAESPERILAPLVSPGTTVVDLGAAMGYFSLPLARMVGESGRVVCVDLQERMLAVLRRRAARRGLAERIETRLATQEEPGLTDLEGQAALVLAAHVVHESTRPQRFLGACRDALRPGGRLLVLEPRGHVSPAEFERTRGLVAATGLVEQPAPGLRRSYTLLAERLAG
jgi:2-polyprenyl-3-methyl-5-hydroxy-6-metoxy-1,4-benzoquinol methylase